MFGFGIGASSHGCWRSNKALGYSTSDFLRRLFFDRSIAANIAVTRNDTYCSFMRVGAERLEQGLDSRFKLADQRALHAAFCRHSEQIEFCTANASQARKYTENWHNPGTKLLLAWPSARIPAAI